jgi:hypothetical protein
MLIKILRSMEIADRLTGYLTVRKLLHLRCFQDKFCVIVRCVYSKYSNRSPIHFVSTFRDF